MNNDNEEKKKSEKIENENDVLPVEIEMIEKETYLKLLADFQNFKMQKIKEIETTKKRERRNTLSKIFDFAEEFMRSFEHIPKKISETKWFEGMENTKKIFDKFLEKEKITMFGKKGEDFNPEIHEAIMQTKGDENKIIQVFSYGYKKENEIIKTAKVSVGNGN